MGASEQQITMAAGLAGGIGLSGGACGALGAAIWVTGMNSSRAQRGQLDYKDPAGLALMEKFIKATDCEFRCSEITGRKFENVEDHAAYSQENGCEKLLEILAMAEESE